MKFTDNLLTGTFLKRYKRFLVDIYYKNKVQTIHCPNSGSMIGLLKEGNRVLFSESKNPKRKLKYTLEMIEINKKWVGVNTFSANKIILEAISQNKLKIFSNCNLIKPEAMYKKGTRFDFYLEVNNKKIFIEVKNVTLSRKSLIAEFPDAITERGSKHLQHLIEAKKKGYVCYMIYLIQRSDCNYFKIADDLDPQYKKMYKKAVNSEIKFLCYDCKLTTEKIEINKAVKILKK